MCRVCQKLEILNIPITHRSSILRNNHFINFVISRHFGIYTHLNGSTVEFNNTKLMGRRGRGILILTSQIFTKEILLFPFYTKNNSFSSCKRNSFTFLQLFFNFITSMFFQLAPISVIPLLKQRIKKRGRIKNKQNEISWFWI